MTKILLNSKSFLIEVIFFHILPFSYQGENFRRRKMTKFWLGQENFAQSVFPKSDVTPSKIHTVINFYTKAFKRFPEKRFRVYRRIGFLRSNYILLKFRK